MFVWLVLIGLFFLAGFFKPLWLNYVGELMKRGMKVLYPSSSFAKYGRLKPETPQINRLKRGKQHFRTTPTEIVVETLMPTPSTGGSDVPSPSLRSLPSIVSILKASGTERKSLMDKRRSRLRKGNTACENVSPNVMVDQQMAWNLQAETRARNRIEWEKQTTGVVYKRANNWKQIIEANNWYGEKKIWKKNKQLFVRSTRLQNKYVIYKNERRDDARTC